MCRMRGAIQLYRTTIAQAHKDDDITTARLFEAILEDEADHHDTFTGLLEEV